MNKYISIAKTKFHSRSLRPRRSSVALVLVATVMATTTLFPFNANAAIAFRSAGTGDNAGGATTLSIPMPAGTVQNDVMIAVISVRGGTGTTITPPASWVLINSNNSTTTLKSSVYRKTAGASESGPYVFTFSSSLKASGVISGYSGVNTSAPINAQGSQANASSATMTSPAVTTTVADT